MKPGPSGLADRSGWPRSAGRRLPSLPVDDDGRTVDPPRKALAVRCPRCHQVSTGRQVCPWCDLSLASVAAEAAWPGRPRRIYGALRGLARFELGEQLDLLRGLGRGVALGVVAGVLAGLSSAGFLVSLTWATDTRLAHPWLLAVLPLAGFGVGLAYQLAGGRAAAGNALIIDEIHDPRAWVPTRMAPLIYAGTVVTHLFGGSAGREGTALQMSGSLSDRAARLLRLRPADRRLLLIAALGGGFGAVFGVPLAGCVFALEVQSVGRLRYDALVPALTAALVGDQVVRHLHVAHAHYPDIGRVELTAPLLGRVVVAGLAFGLCAAAFVELTHGLRRLFASSIRWPPLRPLAGGLIVVGLTLALGTRAYLGLSLPLITAAVGGGAGLAAGAFALKLAFTAITLGSGFQGGEVTPLFVIGATLGAALGRSLGAPVPLLAALGFVAVFAGAANTPLACTVMGIELFGSGPAPLFLVACALSYVFSSHRGIYATQRIDTPKSGRRDAGDSPATVGDAARQRRHWLPPAGRPLP